MERTSMSDEDKNKAGLPSKKVEVLFIIWDFAQSFQSEILIGECRVQDFLYQYTWNTPLN